MRGLCMCVIMALATYGSGEAAAGGWPAPRGPYLGQQPPGDEPQVFAPGLLGTGLFTRDVALTPDGQELYFTVVVGSYDYTAIAGTRVRGGRWTAPEVLPFSGDPAVMDAEPFVTADGKHLFFLSNRPRPGRPAGDRNQDIWVVDRVGERWGGAPRHLGAPVDTDDEEYFPSLTRDGTLYFTRAGKGQPSAIWRARPAAGGFAAPERLPDTVNAGKEHFNAFVAPDESYLLLSITGRPDAIGRSDYYVCFRTPGDAWSAPVNLGPKINVAGGTGYAPYVSPDGRHLFFMSKRLRPELLENGRVSYGRLVQWLGQVETGNPTTYWVAATLLDRLRQAAGSGGPNPP